MTETDIQKSIMVDRWRRSFCMANFTPRKWWECDIFECTEAGYFYEYEIKLSLSDFKADARKYKRLFRPETDGWKHEDKFKHQQMGSEHGPNYFYFVVPAGLLGDISLIETDAKGLFKAKTEIPDWAGLIEVYPRKARQYSQYHRWAITKKAPRLHKKKIDQAILSNAKDTCYYRYHGKWIHSLTHEEWIRQVNIYPHGDEVTWSGYSI